MLYIIYGSDSLARREAFEKLKAELDGDGSLATNHVTFDAKTGSPQEVMAACDAMPFFGDHRLVVVEGLLKQGNRLKKAARRGARAPTAPPPPDDDEGDDDEEDDGGRWAVLAGYIPRMPATTALVMLDDDVSSANVLLKTIGPLGKVEHCTLPIDKELPSWIIARAKMIGLKLDAPAARALANLIGPDPLSLTSEMDKLLAYSGGDIVREADVRELVSRAKEHKGYELADAVVEGRGANAVRILHELIEDGAVAAVLISTIAGRYRRIAVVRDMLARGEPGTEIARRIGAKMGYGLDKLIDQAQRTPPRTIRAAYARLIQAELDLKRGLTGGLMDYNLALELAVQELASEPVAATASR